jgi:hypothetical protein
VPIKGFFLKRLVVCEIYVCGCIVISTLDCDTLLLEAALGVEVPWLNYF